MRLAKYIFIYSIIAIFTSCKYSFPEVDSPSSGSADFTKIVSVGNSLTAGFANGALYDEGQANSFAKIIAGQMALVTPSEYNMPDINSPIGYSGSTVGFPGVSDGTPLGRLILTNPESPFPSPIIPGDPFDEFYSGDKTKLNNFGVPGMRLIDADEIGYANNNPYYKRFASNISSSSVIEDAKAANGSFFTFWLGNNDVLGFATNGAVGNASGDGTDSNDLISLDIFEAEYDQTLSKLLEGGAKGAVANIANVTDVPFFTTIPYNLVSFSINNPLDTLEMYNLNILYEPYNTELEQAVVDGILTLEESVIRQISFSTGSNGVVLTDKNLVPIPGSSFGLIRMANTTDLLTFPAVLIVGTDSGSGLVGTEVPLADQYALTLDEQNLILDRTNGYNEVIAAAVSNHSSDLALVDINTTFKEFAADGVLINGSGLSASIFPPFGGFSLDGVHPNPRAYAFIANNFIDAINKKFNSNIPQVNPNDYPGNELPIPN